MWCNFVELFHPNRNVNIGNCIVQLKLKFILLDCCWGREFLLDLCRFWTSVFWDTFPFSLFTPFGRGDFCPICANFEQALSEIIFLFLLLLLVQGINHRPFDPLNFKWLSEKQRHFCFSLYFQFWNIQNFKWSQV